MTLTPRDIAEERFTKGEIDSEEFGRIISQISQSKHLQVKKSNRVDVVTLVSRLAAFAASVFLLFVSTRSALNFIDGGIFFSRVSNAQVFTITICGAAASAYLAVNPMPTLMRQLLFVGAALVLSVIGMAIALLL